MGNSLRSINASHSANFPKHCNGANRWPIKAIVWRAKAGQKISLLTKFRGEIAVEKASVLTLAREGK
jgi:hypothetical protein